MQVLIILLCIICWKFEDVTAASDVDLANFQPGPNSGLKMVGAAEAVHLGYFVCGAGDFNGDGMKDVLITSEQAHYLARQYCGISYIIFGSSSFSSSVLDAESFQTGAVGIRIIGAATNDYSGSFGGGGGDINNDGYDDVLIGSPAADVDGVTNVGTVTVIFGHNGIARAFADVDLAGLSANVGFRIRGASAGDGLSPCSFIGDMNGDGYDDIALGAQYTDPVSTNEGTAYVIFGKASFADINLGTFTLGTDQGFQFTGNDYDSQFGQYVGMAGDFNGDGYADAMFASWRNGYTYVVFGHSAATNFPNLSHGSWVSSSSLGFKAIGWSAHPYSTAGDVNGDGIDDLVLLLDDSSGYGTTVVLYGHSTGPFPDLNLPGDLTASIGFRIVGAANIDKTHAVLGGDLNGDGIMDFLAFAPGGDVPFRTNAGVGYVLYGQASPYSDIMLSGFVTGASTGYKVLGASAHDGMNLLPQMARLGDVNGDGTDDFVYCASYADYGARGDAGIAYIILSVGVAPTRVPSASPTRRPTSQPSSQPSAVPTGQPNAPPSAQPSTQPTSQPTALPSSQPSCQPSSQPSAQPFSHPSTQPTSQPNAQPTTQPSVNLVTMQSILASPTYRVRNGFAFVVLTPSGYVQTWGEASNGGNSTTVASHLSADVQDVVPSRFGYAAVTANGTLVVWGPEALLEGLSRFTSSASALSSVVANEAAFAAVDSVSGAVIASGSKSNGGDVLDDAHCNGYSVQLSAGVCSITASAGAFAAIKADGSAYVWGNPHAGGILLHDHLASLGAVKSVVATRAAFAAILATGRVAAWGDRMGGGDATAVANALIEVHHIVASRSCFAAFKKDSSLVVWGNSKHGGDTSSVASFLASDVIFVAHTFGAMAAVKSDGTVASWGAHDKGGDSSAVQASLQGIVRIVGNSRAFAALSAGGGVVAWGHSDFGGIVPVGKVTALASDVVSIHHTDRAFAALKSDGSVAVWGQAGHGGEPGVAVEALLTSGVHTVCANDVAFSAIKTDGSVVAWGHAVSVPVDGVQFTSAQLTSPVGCK